MITHGSTPDEARFATERARLVEQLEEQGIDDEAVLRALARVPRHAFVPPSLQEQAYDNAPLPIGEGQTISQPFVVALMSHLARVGPRSRVLEIGTGSGYQAAVLAELGAEVFSVEILEPLARRAHALLARLGYLVHARVGDGNQGWPEEAPFDAILVAAAPPRIPRPLLEQLALGARLVIPVGDEDQTLMVVTRESDQFVEETIAPVRFVPMTGRAPRS